MPTFTYEDTRNGKTFTLDRETEPSESELNQLFLSQESAAKNKDQPAVKPTAMPDSAMQFLGNSETQAPVPAASLEVMSGGFPAAPKAPLPPRPTQGDAIRRSMQLTGNGAFGFPTVSQITQVYFNMQSEYDRAIKPITKSEREKAHDMLTKAWIFERKGQIPNESQNAELLEKAATIGTRPYTNGFLVGSKDGVFVGNAFLDLSNGKMMVRPTGTNKPLREMREDEIPTTAGAGLPHITFPEFRKLNDTIAEDEVSLRGLKRYFNRVDSMPKGIDLFASDLKYAYDSLTGKNASDSQINAQLARGDLTGLATGLRKTVGGGGTLTEGDVTRILEYLGGNISAWNNPEKIKRAIANIYQEKYMRYNDNVSMYNYAVGSYYGRPGSDGRVFFKQKDSMKFDEKLLGGADSIYGVQETVKVMQDQLLSLESEQAKRAKDKTLK